MTDSVNYMQTKTKKLDINKVKTKSIEDSIVFYVLISLFCVNFLGRGSIVCLLFGIFAILKINGFRLDVGTVLCLVLSISSMIASMIYKDLFEAIKCLNFFLMYVVGYNGFYRSIDKKKFITRTVFAIFLGFAAYILLTYLSNLKTVPEYEGQRLIINFWTNERIAVTLVGLISSVVIGYSGYILLCKKRYIAKVFVLLALAIVVLLNAKTATRTPILLIPIVLGLMFIVYLFNQNAIKALKITVVLVICLLVVLVLIDNNIFGIKTYIESTPIFNRFQTEGNKTSRVHIFQENLSYFWDYMWGGGNIEKEVGKAAHNFLQQGHDLYGIFATIPLILITICVLKSIFKLLVKRKKCEMDYLFLSMYISMLIQACLEPIFTGYPCFFFSFLLIHGMATGYIKKGISIDGDIK